ncbi:hypothetical protein Q5M85_12160 [Paraclostridium bifermentans]|nr:hypothetical protein [Paraclostridium bifermentans]
MNSYLENMAKNMILMKMLEFMGVLTHDEVFDWLDTTMIYVFNLV